MKLYDAEARERRRLAWTAFWWGAVVGMVIAMTVGTVGWVLYASGHRPVISTKSK